MHKKHKEILHSIILKPNKQERLYIPETLQYNNKPTSSFRDVQLPPLAVMHTSQDIPLNITETNSTNLKGNISHSSFQTQYALCSTLNSAFFW